VTDLSTAIDALRAGKLVVIPTDTVYGIAALPAVPGAVDAVFAVKGRSRHKPLPVLGAGVAHLAGVVVIDDWARRLGARFWPGPLTLVLPRAPGFDEDLGGDRTATVAVRVPDFAPALELLEATGPLAVTSANLSGEEPATTVAEARTALGAAVEVFVDGGRVAGTPSTVVALDPGPTILRPGGIPPERLLETLRS
jgi:L-threonylcarbamoyladenylate synthase